MADEGEPHTQTRLPRCDPNDDEQTVPCEKGCDEAQERKSSKYWELKETCQDRGWKTWLFPVEVGCGGFPVSSVWTMLKAIGICDAIGKEQKSPSQDTWRDSREGSMLDMATQRYQGVEIPQHTVRKTSSSL